MYKAQLFVGVFKVGGESIGTLPNEPFSEVKAIDKKTLIRKLADAFNVKESEFINSYKEFKEDDVIFGEYYEYSENSSINEFSIFVLDDNDYSVSILDKD